MKLPLSFLGILLISTLGAAQTAQADSLIDGNYRTATDGSEGANATPCNLSIQSLTGTHKYGDELFQLESSGAGACNWSAVGVSKSFVITGGLITNSGLPAFFKITFPFGPAGKRVELTEFDIDGTVRHRELFTRP